MPDIDELFERLERLEGVASDFREWRSGIMVEHSMLKDGVANFKEFKARGNTFFDRAEARWEADEKRRKNWLAFWGILAIFLVPLTTWGGAQIIRAGITIYQIEQDWQRAHPSEFKQNPSLYKPSEPIYARDKVPQDAQLPNLR